MIVPTGGDIDASLRSLRIQFNDIDGVGVQQNKSVQIERGKILIAVRQLLELKNGRDPNPTHVGPDGLAPRGWMNWVKENLTICRSQAHRSIVCAVDPSQVKEGGRRKRVIKSIRGFKAAWALYTDENKRQIAEFVIAEVRKEQTL